MDSNLEIYDLYRLAGGNSFDSDATSVELGEQSTSATNENEDESHFSQGFNYQHDSQASGFSYQSFSDDSFRGEEEEEEEEDPCSCSEPSLVSKLTQRSYKPGWARFGVEPDPWEDSKQPLCKVLDYEDLELTEEEKNGVLTDRIIFACSSFLDQNPETQKYTVAKLVASEKHIYDIQILEMHRYLQYIDLSHNYLTNIWPLSGVPYLMHLNVSHNEITDVLNFKAPWNLTYVDFSHNNVTSIKDLSEFWSLVYLDLSNNQITKISGLENLRYLNCLNLSMNAITCFENLNHLDIEILDICRNRIRAFEEGPDAGMKTMTNLSIIDISCNHLTTLAIFKGAYHLKMVNAEQNEVAELYEIDHMKGLRELADLNLSGNGMTKWPKYRPMVINTIRTLAVLDEIRVETQERVGASVTFDPDVHIKAACEFARLQLLEVNSSPCLGLDVLPVDQGPYPLVVLVGPDGSMKENLINWVAARCADKVYKSVMYTSRSKALTEVEGSDYYFVSQEEFNELAKSGTFLYIFVFLGDSYGVSRHELAKAVKLQKLCLAPMEILGALTLRAYGVEPTLVLAMADDEDLHFERLRGKYRASLLQSSAITSMASMPSCAAVSISIGVVPDFLNLKPTQSTELKEKLITSADSSDPLQDVSADTVSFSEEEDDTFNYCKLSVKTDQSVSEISEVPLEDEVSDWFPSAYSRTGSIITDTETIPSSKTLTIKQSHDTYFSSSQRLSRSEDFFGSRFLESSTSHNVVQFRDPSLAAVNPEGIQLNPDSSLMITSISGVISDVQTQSSKIVSREGSSQSQVTVESSSMSALSQVPVHNADNCGSVHDGDLASCMSSQEANGESATKVISQKSVEKPEPESVERDRSVQTRPLLSSSEDAYIKSILNTREVYLATHRENPGVFAETINTDNVFEAREKLERFVKATYRARPQRYPSFNIEEDKAYQAMMALRLHQFQEEIYNEQRTMSKQLDEMQKYKPPRVPPQRRSSVIEREMRTTPNSPPQLPCL